LADIDQGARRFDPYGLGLQEVIGRLSSFRICETANFFSLLIDDKLFNLVFDTNLIEMGHVPGEDKLGF
jgi:hypothetical protein